MFVWFIADFNSNARAFFYYPKLYEDFLISASQHKDIEIAIALNLFPNLNKEHTYLNFTKYLGHEKNFWFSAYVYPPNHQKHTPGIQRIMNPSIHDILNLCHLIKY